MQRNKKNVNVKVIKLNFKIGPEDKRLLLVLLYKLQLKGIVHVGFNKSPAHLTRLFLPEER